MTLESLGYSAAQNNIIKLIYQNPGITRKELAESSGISSRTILKFVSEFIENGIVTNYEKNKSTGGRNAERLIINPNFKYILGVDVGSYAVKIGVVKLSGETVEDELICRDTPDAALVDTPDKLCRKLSEYIKKYGKNSFMGVGISITGLVSGDGKSVNFSPNIPLFNNVDITEKFEKALGIPVCLDTSARSLALAEARYGKGVGYDNQIFVSVGHSISAGIIIGGRLFGGSNGSAGEIGHTKSADKGIRCSCGNLDCLEVYATLPMIVRSVKRALKSFAGYSPILNLTDSIENINPHHIKEAVQLKDRLVTECISDAGKKIGFALSHMINALNPEIIVFGGSVTEFLPEVIDEAVSYATEFSLISSVQNLKTEKSALGNKAAIMGCGVGVMNRFFGV